MSSGEIPLLKRKFDLIQTLQDIIDLYKARAHEKRLTLLLQSDPTLPHFVIGDKIRLHRIILELVGNALNFTDKGQVLLNIELAKQKDRFLVVKVTVTDSGIGIPNEVCLPIFRALLEDRGA